MARSANAQLLQVSEATQIQGVWHLKKTGCLVEGKFGDEKTLPTLGKLMTIVSDGRISNVISMHGACISRSESILSRGRAGQFSHSKKVTYPNCGDVGKPHETADLYTYYLLGTDLLEVVTTRPCQGGTGSFGMIYSLEEQPSS